MIDSQQEQPRVEIKARWTDGTDLPQLYVDEALLQYVNDRIFLSLGQIQVPPIQPDETVGERIAVKPVARLVFTQASFHKLAALFSRVAELIPNPTAAEE